MSEATGPVCLGCGAPLRATFCGRCGARAGEASPRAHEGVGVRGLPVALACYFGALAPVVGLALFDAFSRGALLVATAVILGVALAGAAALGRPVWGLYRPPRLPPLEVVAWVVASALLVAAIVGLLSVWPGDKVRVSDTYLAEGLTLADALLDVAVLTPLVEELLFRGVILTGLSGVFRPRTAVVVSGMLFGTIHLSVTAFVTHSLFGVVLGWACVRSRSLWPGIVLHAAWNAFVVWQEWPA